MHPTRLSLLLVGAVLAACSPKKDPTPPTVKPALTITSASVQLQDLPRVIEAQGQVLPWQEAVLSARVAGLPLLELKAQVGDRVRQGQVLARFDDRTVQADLAQARASLAQATAQAAQAAADRDRTLQLKGTGAVSEQDLQAAVTQAAAAEAQRQIAQAQVSSQDIRLKDTEVVAVDDGVISARSVTLGQVAQAGTELFRLIRQERLEWRAELKAEQFTQIKPGQLVDLTLSDGQHAKGKVRQLAPALDGATRLGLAYVDVEIKSPARAGMYVSGVIQLTRGAVPVVPAEAVVLRDGRNSVFVLGQDDVVRQVPVVAGRRIGDVVEITQGLQAGDVVTVRGAGFLNDGDRVRRADDAAPSTPGAVQ